MNTRKLLKQIKDLDKLSYNWDGYNGVTPSTQTIKDVIKFIKLLPKNCVTPRLGVSNDGEIGLFWEGVEIFIDVGFVGDFQYSYYISQGNKDNYEEFFCDDIQINKKIEEHLLYEIENNLFNNEN